MPDLKQAWAFLENSDGVASAGEVQAAIRRVAAEISERLSGAYPMVFAVMRRNLRPACTTGSAADV